jgi:hypothetical protein
MGRGAEAVAQGARSEPSAGDPANDPPVTLIPDADWQSRVCELETENARLRLLVSELLAANQRLREGARPIRSDGQAA